MYIAIQSTNAVDFTLYRMKLSYYYYYMCDLDYTFC